ncbi:MAG: LysM peptidoglycan-binding domain-containing protein [Anaerolineales bacterium]|nr:LysM peptidoglycan-binding domain-containing protein [Anaerolineales bacterium]
MNPRVSDTTLWLDVPPNPGSRRLAAGWRFRAGRLLGPAVFLFLSVSACGPEELPATIPATATAESAELYSVLSPTPLPTRLLSEPGQIMDYQAQSGDTLEAVAAHFRTTVEDIRRQNPDLPGKITTLIPGEILRVPVYLAPFTGTPFQILPDSEVAAGPSTGHFSGSVFVENSPGYLKDYAEFVFGMRLDGWGVVETVARDFSVHPRLLLALLEYRSGALSRDDQSEALKAYPLGSTDITDIGLGMQLSWAAEMLNEGYYGWRTGWLGELELADGRVSHPDPWQNAGTVAVQYLLAHWFGQDEFDLAVGPEGFVQTYRRLFGDPFGYAEELIPGGLLQPAMQLPFEPGKIWIYTGGPHSVWGHHLPWAAVDFAPPSETYGCQESPEWATAAADGLVARSGPATVVLDLDFDGDEHTGWIVFYFHVAEAGRIPAGARLRAGDRIGHPSCEGGTATGSHIHIARRYNGEWISAGGPLAFNLSDWIVGYGDRPYQGTLSYYLEAVLHAYEGVTPDNRIMLPAAATPTPAA